MPFFEDIGKKISNMGQTAVEKTKCSTETLRLNNQIREEQRLCKDLYQQIGQQYAQQYETNPDPAFESLMKQLHDAQERITSYQEQIQIKKSCCQPTATVCLFDWLLLCILWCTTSTRCKILHHLRCKSRVDASRTSGNTISCLPEMRQPTCIRCVILCILRCKI